MEENGKEVLSSIRIKQCEKDESGRDKLDARTDAGKRQEDGSRRNKLEARTDAGKLQKDGSRRDKLDAKADASSPVY